MMRDMEKKAVIAYFDGSMSKTAKAFGITHSAVWQWREIVPERIAWKAQALTAGTLRVDPSVYAKRKGAVAA